MNNKLNFVKIYDLCQGEYKAAISGNTTFFYNGSGLKTIQNHSNRLKKLNEKF